MIWRARAHTRNCYNTTYNYLVVASRISALIWLLQIMIFIIVRFFDESAKNKMSFVVKYADCKVTLTGKQRTVGGHRCRENQFCIAQSSHALTHW